jgi:hypothetical protein
MLLLRIASRAQWAADRTAGDRRHVEDAALPITPEEQARNARAIADLAQRMLAMPDEDPPGVWEEAMRDLDAHRPYRRLFEGLY